MAVLAALGAWRCPAAVAARGATAQRTGEPAWHRRDRRRRAQARTLLRVANAAAILGNHHSAQGMGKNNKGKGDDGRRSKQFDDWVCPINACSYVNFAYRKRCRLCDAHPSDRKPPPQETGGRGGKGGGSVAGAKPTLAERQLEAARAQQKQQQMEVTALRREKAALERRLASAAKEAAEAPNGGEDEDEDDVETTENVEQELERLVRRRKALSDGGWEDDEELPKQLDEQIKGLRKKRDEAKPQHVRLVKVDRRIAKLQKKVDGHRKELQEVQGRLDELVAERDGKQVQLDAALKELDEAKEERSAEYQRALDEEREERKLGTEQRTSADSPTKVAFEAIKADARANLEGAPMQVVSEIDGALARLEALLASVPRKVVAATQPNERSVKGKGGAAAASSGAAGGVAGNSGGTNKDDVGTRKGETGDQTKGATDGQRGSGSPSPADPVPNVLAPNGQLPKPANGSQGPASGKGDGQDAGNGGSGAAEGATVGSDNDDELLEDSGTNADVDMDKPISGLPSRQKEMVMAMLRECRAKSPEGAKPRDRERSPRRVDESAM